MDNASVVAARRIIERFGGPNRLADLLAQHYKAPGLPAIRNWRRAGIPSKWQHEVLYVAKLAGIGLAPEDFFEADPLSPGDAA
jgi:hypothetical protein